MQRLEFGVLVSLLRNEHGWTQFQLAEYSGIENSTLSNIERGAKKYFEPDLLFRLANALQLTSLERREFFLASCGLDQKQIVRQPSVNTPTKTSDVLKMLEKLTELMSQMCAPAHLGDVYGDVIAVNNIFLETLGIDSSLLKILAQKGVRINNLQFAFDTQVESAIHGKSSETIVSLLRAFREGSLRYRCKLRYSELMQTFKNMEKYPLFDRYWRRVSTIEDDKESMFDLMEVEHKTYGLLRFTVTSSVTITSYGELFLSHYFPMDINTASSVIKIAEKVGAGVLHVSSWPLPG